ncbi:ANTAR domain-containing protein [Kribbella sp. NPDC050820]|uniref:ANTAR domain-containing protein n=1 Tax=Kribbella sp. NPDC050820 TaxID=3155408 RepID=UPI0033CE41C7
MAATFWTEWVDQDRKARIWAAIDAVAEREKASPSLQHAVLACTQVLSATGAGLSMIRDGGGLEPVLATGPLIGELDELQSTLGEGPGCDAVVAGAPVLYADLSGAEAGWRWPAFAPVAAERDVCGVFAFLVGAGAARLGVLNVYRRQAEPLRPDELQDALVFADALFVLALDEQRGLSADLHAVIDTAFVTRRAEVHQAAGMVAAQQKITVTDALARLRAHAYSQGDPLHLIAADVMAGRLRLASDPDDGTNMRRSDGRD